VFAAIDFGYKWYTHEQSLKMSRREIMDEMRHQEGDPMVKAQRRSFAGAATPGRRDYARGCCDNEPDSLCGRAQVRPHKISGSDRNYIDLIMTRRERRRCKSGSPLS